MTKPATSDLAAELSALRAEIARLSARECAIAAALSADPAAQRPIRPGWPIHRLPPQQPHQPKAH